MNFDLSTSTGRNAAINALEKSFINSLRQNDIELSEDAICSIGRSQIQLGIKEKAEHLIKGFKMEFSSIIELYAKIENSEDNMFDRDNEINFGSSGSFSPKSKACYWRTIHAASVLKNWNVVCEIVNVHCKAYVELYKDIQSINAIIK